MDITSTPTKYWLICTLYVINLMQLISQPSLGGIRSMQKVTGFVQDTSKCLHYHWWQPIYYLNLGAAVQAQPIRKRVVGVAGLMILVMFSPTGSLLMTPSNLFLYLISVLPLHAPICMLKLVILLPPFKGSPKCLGGL